VCVRLESPARKIIGRAPLRADSPLHVLIVGASYGGLALAHGLGRAGVSCALYEARSGRAEREPLRELLLTGLEDRVHFAKRFTHYQRRADGTVTAFFADGGSASGQVLVAADGAHSAVRAQYRPELIPRPHLNVRGFCPATDPGAAFPLQVVAAELAPAWQASNVTLVGDAIHAVTPGPRAGANSALRDAMLLTRALSFVRANRVGLRNAVAAYETEMIRASRADRRQD
jgi:2-polyprenyl-6-methoxyphenol hydroxylase-like FAD-dependent oxidoreductase